MDFEQMIEKADRAMLRIKKILDQAFAEKDESSYAMKLSVLVTVIDTLAIEAGKDPNEEKRMLAIIGEAVEAMINKEDISKEDRS